MIVDSKEKFERAISTAMDATSEIYEAMDTYLRNAEYWTKTTILGTPLYEAVLDLPEDMLRQVELIVSLRAFTEGIPFIDLVLTPTGFGIVSNTNLAPASKDRVDRLQKQSVDVMEDAIDALIVELNKSTLRDKWAEGDPYADLTSQLFWTANELRLYAGRSAAHRSTLMELRPNIAAAQQAIAERISRDYLKALLEKQQTNTLDIQSKVFVHTLKSIAGYFLQGMGPMAEKELDFLVNMMDARPEKFPEYIASQEYQLKQVAAYENKKEDSVYFFG